jgi:hypothetical protein
MNCAHYTNGRKYRQSLRKRFPCVLLKYLKMVSIKKHCVRPQVALIFLVMLAMACKKESKGPVCRFTSISRSGSKFAVSYSGDTLVTVGGNYPGYILYFNTQGSLVRREEPVTDPFYRSELAYNAMGQVSELRLYTKLGSSWVYQGKMSFTYDNRRIINLRDENSASQNGDVFDDQIIWEGNDIKSVVHRLNQQTVCTTQFSYDGAIANPMRPFCYFYFCDGDANYSYYKLPFYFSEHLVTKQESNCTYSETRLFTYTFTSNSHIASMSDRGNTLWAYEYECR